jgi:hypothetical protein
VNQPAAASIWQRLARRVRSRVAGMRGSSAATRTVREYTRVLPVLAGQVREAASHIEDTVLDVTTGLGSLVDRARRAVSSARARSAARHTGQEVNELIVGARQAFERLHARGVDTARRSAEAGARIEDAICALEVISLRVERDMPDAVAIRSLLADLENSLTPAMRALRHSAEADVAHLIHDTATAARTVELLGARDAAIRHELDTAAHDVERLAEEVSAAAAALRLQDRANQRLQHVIDTLSEMQDEFVATLERPENRTEPTGSAALRLRQRYTAAAARQ